MSYLLTPGGYSAHNTVHNPRDQPRRADAFTCMSLCALNTILRYLRLYLAFLFLSSTTFTRQLPRSLSHLTAGKYVVDVGGSRICKRLVWGFASMRNYIWRSSSLLLDHLLRTTPRFALVPPYQFQNPQVIRRDMNACQES